MPLAPLTRARRRPQDKRSFARSHGRAFRGRRTTTARLFLRGKRYSLVTVLSSFGMLDWYICEGSVDHVRFLDFILRCVVCKRSGALLPPLPADVRRAHPRAQVPIMQPFPNPHSVLVMDNFTTHWGTQVLEAVEEAGGVVHHTPPYSCDMSPIEPPFAKIKAYLRGAHKARLEVVRGVRLLQSGANCMLTPRTRVGVDGPLCCHQRGVRAGHREGHPRLHCALVQHV